MGFPHLNLETYNMENSAYKNEMIEKVSESFLKFSDWISSPLVKTIFQMSCLGILLILKFS